MSRPGEQRWVKCAWCGADIDTKASARGAAPAGVIHADGRRRGTGDGTTWLCVVWGDADGPLPDGILHLGARDRHVWGGCYLADRAEFRMTRLGRT